MGYSMLHYVTVLLVWITLCFCWLHQGTSFGFLAMASCGRALLFSWPSREKRRRRWRVWPNPKKPWYVACFQSAVLKASLRVCLILFQGEARMFSVCCAQSISQSLFNFISRGGSPWNKIKQTLRDALGTADWRHATYHGFLVQWTGCLWSRALNINSVTSPLQEAGLLAAERPERSTGLWLMEAGYDKLRVRRSLVMHPDFVIFLSQNWLSEEQSHPKKCKEFLLPVAKPIQIRDMMSEYVWCL